MDNVIFDTNIFYDAVIEEIVNENTLRIAIRDIDSKIIKICKIDGLNVSNEIKKLFIIDLLKSMIPVGSYVKIKVLENNENILIFNRKLDINFNKLITIINNSNVNYNV